MQTDLLAALKEAIRFNAPDEHRLGFRRVGFILPDEVAWPADKTGYDIPDAILAALAASPLSGEMGEVEQRVRNGVLAALVTCQVFEKDTKATADRIANTVIAALRSSGIDGEPLADRTASV